MLIHLLDAHLLLPATGIVTARSRHMPVCLPLVCDLLLVASQNYLGIACVHTRQHLNPQHLDSEHLNVGFEQHSRKTMKYFDSITRLGLSLIK